MRRSPFRFGISIGVLGVAMATQQASAVDLSKAIDEALRGKETKFVKVDDREFHIKPILVVRTAKGVSATGRISHHRSKQLDDQVSYLIEIDEGKPTRVSFKVTRGGASVIVRALPRVPNELGEFIDQLTAGTWEAELGQIINTIAAKLRRG
jgi:hypothetical protein